MKSNIAAIVAPRSDSPTVSYYLRAQNFLTESVEVGTEGLIVKTLADTYEPSKRSSHWLKLKKDYMASTVILIMR